MTIKEIKLDTLNNKPPKNSSTVFYDHNENDAESKIL